MKKLIFAVIVALFAACTTDETQDVAVYYEEQHPYIGEQWKNYDYLIVIDDTEKNREYINNVLNIDSDENFIVLDEWKNQ